MPNIDRLNELLRREIALSINKLVDFPDGLITITDVNCAENFRSMRISFSVIPDRLTGTAFDLLRKNSGSIAEKIGKTVKLRKMPKLLWFFDDREKNASHLEKVFEKLEKGEEKAEIEENFFNE